MAVIVVGRRPLRRGEGRAAVRARGGKAPPGEAARRPRLAVRLHRCDPASRAPYPALGGDIKALRDAAETALKERCASRSPKRSTVEIERRVVEGRPAAVLVDESQDADLLVVGSRGHGGFTGLLLGSVSQQCAHHAACPVVIVHRKPERSSAMDVRLKRAYEPPAASDGYRVLIDRLWPRGVSKQEAQLDEWARELAPSSELRRWFGHDPATVRRVPPPLPRRARGARGEAARAAPAGARAGH